MAARALVKWPVTGIVSHLVWDDELGGWLIDGSGPFSNDEIVNEMGGEFLSTTGVRYENT